MGFGGYDVLGTGAVDDPTRGGAGNYRGRTLQEISAGSSDDDSYVAAIQANVDAQLAQQQQIAQEQQAAATARALQAMQTPYERLLETASRVTSSNLSGGMGNVPVLQQLAMRAGQAPSRAPEGLMGKVPSFMGTAANKIGEMATGKMFTDVVEQDYIPQYDAMGQIVATINPETGQYGAGSVVARIDPNNPANTAPPPVDLGDDDGFVAPEATAVAALQPEAEAEPSMVQQGYLYPAGGIYPTEGEYMRQGLLDVAPQAYGGLLAGYDPTQFGSMNVGFRQPINVGAYPDPRDVTGYALI